MNKIIILLVLSLVLIGGMIGIKVMQNNDVLNSTDISKVKHKINIGVDNWAGYFFLCSKQLRKKGIENEILITCDDDNADFESRVSKLKSGDLQMAAFTADSYIKNAEDDNYPAKFVTVIDESQGGDAIYMNKNIASNVDELRKLSNLKISYTTNSPSEMLLTTWKKDFGIEIDNPNKFVIVETNGSTEAFQLLMSGKVDLAVVWQPEAVKIEKSNKFIKLLGSEQTKNIIVDTLVVENKYMVSNPDVVKKFMELYYETMDYYKVNSEEFDDELKSKTQINDDEQLQALKDGIKWHDLSSVAVNWLGVNHSGGKGNLQLYDTINMVTKIMANDGQLSSSNPLPNNDAFSLINSNFIGHVVSSAENGSANISFVVPNKIEDVSISRKFKKLSPAKWARLRNEKTVGSIDIPTITFSTGTNQIYPQYNEQESFEIIEDIMLKYPRYRLIIEGHTGRGDEKANMDLSKQRANEVKDLILDNMGVNKHRIMTIGYGANQPPKRAKGESKRAWWKRWARVNIIVVHD